MHASTPRTAFVSVARVTRIAFTTEAAISACALRVDVTIMRARCTSVAYARVSGAKACT